jgi:hypothetical protein
MSVGDERFGGEYASRIDLSGHRFPGTKSTAATIDKERENENPIQLQYGEVGP